MISMTLRARPTAEMWAGEQCERTRTLHLIRGWPEGIAQK